MVTDAGENLKFAMETFCMVIFGAGVGFVVGVVVVPVGVVVVSVGVVVVPVVLGIVVGTVVGVVTL
jgi:hypothetical protein